MLDRTNSIDTKPRRHTKDVGDISEAMLTATLLRAGYGVLRPVGDNRRYDLVIDDGSELWRVQVKTGAYMNGGVNFRPCSSHYHRGRASKNYRGDVDLFGVYCPELDKSYLVPVSHVGVAWAVLRVDSPANNQTKKIRIAADYEI